MAAQRFIDVVFDGPPSHKTGRFVETEDEDGRSFNAGEWIDRGDGYWALRIKIPPKRCTCETCKAHDARMAEFVAEALGS